MPGHILVALLVAAYVAVSLLSAGHALLMKRDPRSALGWIITCITVPFLGPLLYWSMGVNRINRRAKSWQETGRRLANHHPFKASREPDRRRIPPGYLEHLVELSVLADRVVKSPLVPGNNLLPLHNGEEAYPAMLEAIASARHSINLSTYIFDGDTTGRRFVDALKSAAARGVEVRLIIDGLGEKYSSPTARRLLKGSPVKVCRFLPLRQGAYLNLRSHRKVLVVDGSVAFTGGMNIGDRHMVSREDGPPPVADVHFKVKGPVVAELQRVFLEDWHFVSGELVEDPSYFPPGAESGTAVARAISDGPDKQFRKLEWIIMGALACSRQKVLIMTPYFIPDRAMISSLCTAAMRGVSIVIILPELNNLPFVHWATRAYLWELLQHGIQVYYQPPPFVHTKLFLVDRLWSLIGSANLDPRSLRLNFELNVEVYDRGFTEKLAVHFEEVLSRSRQVFLADMDARPLSHKLRDGAAKLWSPYL